MKRIYFVIIIILVCFLLSSCDSYLFRGSTVFGSEELFVSFVLPAWPPSDSGLLSVVYPELSHWIVEVHTPSFTGKYDCEPGDNLDFLITRDEPLAITATPVCFDNRKNKVAFFKCAGAVYPFTKDSMDLTGEQSELSVVLSWENGFTAFLMQSIFRNGKKLSYNSGELRDYILRFNWNKLINYIEEKQSDEENFYNPWLLDIAEVLGGIAYSSFKASFLNQKGVFKLDCGENNLILSSYVPENKNIQKKCRILLKKSDVNVFSDYNFNGIIIKGDSVQKVSIEYISLPLYIEEYENTFESLFSFTQPDYAILQ